MNVYYTCQKCGEELEVDVAINEDDDLPENCPVCSEPFGDAAHEKVQQLAWEKASDPIEDFR